MHQNTIAINISARGKGAITGETIQFSILPAPAHCGIIFRRVDILPVREYKIGSDFPSESNDESEFRFLGSRNAIRHLIAVFSALNIDNVFVDIYGAELPEMEDRASAFLFLVQSAGLKSQSAKRSVIELSRPIVISHKGSSVKLVPGRSLRIGCFDNVIKELSKMSRVGKLVEFSKALFVSEICHARPSQEILSQLSEHQKMKMNCARHNRMNWLIKEYTFRKMLNIVGDLAFLGRPINADYVGFNVNHELNMKLLEVLSNDQKLLTQKVSSTQLNNEHCQAGFTPLLKQA